MANDDAAPAPPLPQSTMPANISSSTEAERTTLVEKARAFLMSPHIHSEDDSVKRKFLMDKGLSDEEVELLLQQSPLKPAIPPRTYPQPPPSNLPSMLIGVLKIMTWITGSSALLLMVYYKLLLPRLTRSANARMAIKAHHTHLLKRLTESLTLLKEERARTQAVLPKLPPFREDPQYAHCHDLLSLKIGEESPIDVPPPSFLRCALEDPAFQGKSVKAESLFAMLEERYPWLKTGEGLQYETAMWNALREIPYFQETNSNGEISWSYQAPDKALYEETTLLSSLSSLKNVTQQGRRGSSPYKYTLNAMTDLTGYITSQTYSFTTSFYRVPGMSNSPSLTQQQEDIRKEIRALKGLVLNRRTFAPPPSNGVTNVVE